MDSSRFDEFTKALVTSNSRRQVLKALAVTGVGGILAFIGIDVGGDAFAQKAKKHCINLGHTCSSSKSCCSGNCHKHKCACKHGTTHCGNKCMNIHSDSNNCGACGTVCPSGQICSNGTCGCASNQITCNGTCTDKNTDAKNCGACGTVCPTGQICCNGICTDAKSDINNCGQCGNKCSFPNGTVECVSGLCAFKSCNTGFVDCATSKTCVDLSNDPNNCGSCGTKCPSGQICSNGKCCQSGQTACNGICTDTKSDINNCGKCGTICPTGKTCNNGSCS
jgi:hypothetical protein